MSFIQLLKKGYKITIYDTLGRFMPTKFYMKGKEIWYENGCLGVGVHEAITRDNKRFTAHIKSMIDEGMSFKIEK